MNEYVLYAIAAVAAYLIGCISFSYIICKIVTKKDIRESGSNNAGSTNVLRTMGLKYAIISLVGDIGKAVAAVFLGKFIAGEMGMYIAALFVIAGHNWPVFLKFKGGKGVASTIGALACLMPLQTLIAIVFGVTLIVITKIVSIGSMSGIFLGAVLSFVFYPGNTPLHIVATALFVLTMIMHRQNIKRLLKGEENKIGSKKKAS